jgi:trypsin
MRLAARLGAVLGTAALAATGLASTPSSAIVGGSDVPNGKYRFMASVQYAGERGSDGHFCGGSVVAPRWVLTAAHCVADEKASDLQVTVGKTDLESAGGQTLRAGRIVVHPKWAETGTFDAALIRTRSAMNVPTIPLVPLRNQSLERSGTTLTVAGWGTELFGAPVAPSRMKSVDVDVVADGDCITNSIVLNFRPRSEICAEKLGGDSCQGDSGGPLFGKLAGGRRVQVGIVSYGLGCATPEFPGVYGEVNNPSIHRFITSRIS